MARRDNFNFMAFIKSTFIGILIIVLLALCVFRYVSSIAAKTENNEHDNDTNEYVFNENTNKNSYNETDEISQPVFINTLSPEELKLQPETDITYDVETEKVNVTEDDIKNLKDLNYLKSNFYIIDHRTDLIEGDIDAEKFLNMDFSIDKSTDGPKVLIFHTHSCEMYSDSDPSKGMSEGIWGVGEELKNILEQKYNIRVMHDTGRYDFVDGKNQILGAYERMEPAIMRILSDNPSIEVVIDLHRDGVNEGVRLISDVNGKTCAKVMFFNGLCRLNENGSLNDISSLPNPYLKDNLAFSFNMQVTANKLYPEFTRKIYLNAYRYSLNMKPKSLLVEVGAQTNTKQEAKNAMEPLADVLSRVILSE